MNCVMNIGARKFCSRAAVFYPNHHFELHLGGSSDPLYQLHQQRKLLESQLVSILDGCNEFTQIKQVHAHIFRKGLEQCCYVLTKLIRMLTKVGVPMDSYPRRVFDQVNRTNPFIWSALIRGYTLQGHSSEAFVLYNRMRKEGPGPVSFTFTALFKACTAALDFSAGMQLHAQTIFLGRVASDLFVGNALIDMYVKSGSLDCGRRVFEEMPEKDIISWTSLIVAYARNGAMYIASGFFDRLPVKDMVAWTAMVTGYAQNANPRKALEYFEKMQGTGVTTDEVTLVGVISACAQLGAAKYASRVQEVAEQSGFGPSVNVVVGSALIDMYSKCGRVEEAHKVFASMREKNVFSYSSMILGFAMHGFANDALQLFYEMLKTNTKPNRVTLIGVLTACSHAGLVEDGRRLFATMEECYGVTPSADHYACMVDLLGRAGRLGEALELAQSMSPEPHGGVWGALLGACRIHNNPDIAEIAAKHLFELEPNGIGNYVLLSNIYASAGKWHDVRRVRTLMRAKGLRKNPACSWMEAGKGEIHRFFAGDMTHARSGEIKQALDDLLEKLKVQGYLPNLSSAVYDVTDDEKKRILMAHSEKLALAFGLLSTSAGSTITIVKNVRICEDCHTFMCMASYVTQRRIVIRDNLRFHHFCDGSCSCNNFW